MPDVSTDLRVFNDFDRNPELLRKFDKALDASDYDGFEARAEASVAAGKIRGRAAVYYMERTGGGPDEPDGVGGGTADNVSSSSRAPA